MIRHHAVFPKCRRAKYVGARGGNISVILHVYVFHGTLKCASKRYIEMSGIIILCVKFLTLY
jgi:hypothetical protein